MAALAASRCSRISYFSWSKLPPRTSCYLAGVAVPNLEVDAASGRAEDNRVKRPVCMSTAYVCYSIIGSVITKVAPSPMVLSTWICPSCWVIIWALIARPRPVPCGLVV